MGTSVSVYYIVIASDIYHVVTVGPMDAGRDGSAELQEQRSQLVSSPVGLTSLEISTLMYD